MYFVWIHKSAKGHFSVDKYIVLNVHNPLTISLVNSIFMVKTDEKKIYSLKLGRPEIKWCQFPDFMPYIVNLSRTHKEFKLFFIIRGN